jgi:hypothetical protein
VVIGTDYIGSCKSTYHTITATMTPPPLSNNTAKNTIYHTRTCFTLSICLFVDNCTLPVTGRLAVHGRTLVVDPIKGTIFVCIETGVR